MPNCEICRFVESPHEPLLDAEFWQVNLATDQAYLGRCYVALKEHKPDLSALNLREWNDYREVVQIMEGACRNAFGAKPFNWSCLMNNTFQEAEPDPHVHWHFRPRHAGPVVVGGMDFRDPNFGYHYDSSIKREIDQPTYQAIFEAIQSQM